MGAYYFKMLKNPLNIKLCEFNCICHDELVLPSLFVRQASHLLQSLMDISLVGDMCTLLNLVGMSA